MFLISISIVLLFYYQCIVKPIVLHCKSVDFAPQKSCLRIVKVQLLFFRGDYLYKTTTTLCKTTIYIQRRGGRVVKA